MDSEIYTVAYFIENQIRKRLNSNYIGSFIDEKNNNKLINLKIAQEIGLRIPKTLITTSKQELLDFYEKHEVIITQDLRAPVNITTPNKFYGSTGVKKVDLKMLKMLKEHFAPIFTQEYIQKQYEIRTFIFQEQTYSMAIFSQKSKKNRN